MILALTAGGGILDLHHNVLKDQLLGTAYTNRLGAVMRLLLMIFVSATLNELTSPGWMIPMNEGITHMMGILGRRSIKQSGPKGHLQIGASDSDADGVHRPTRDVGIVGRGLAQCCTGSSFLVKHTQRME